MDIIENNADALKKEKEKEKKNEKKKEKKRELRGLAFERIRITFERLQIAWLKAAMSFIAIGFTAYKIFYERMKEGFHPISYLVNGRSIGLFLIILGFSGLLQATIHHRNNLAKLKKLYPNMVYSVSLVQSYFILILSLVLFILVLLRA